MKKQSWSQVVPDTSVLMPAKHLQGQAIGQLHMTIWFTATGRQSNGGLWRRGISLMVGDCNLF